MFLFRLAENIRRQFIPPSAQITLAAFIILVQTIALLVTQVHHPGRPGLMAKIDRIRHCKMCFRIFFQPKKRADCAIFFHFTGHDEINFIVGLQMDDWAPVLSTLRPFDIKKCQTVPSCDSHGYLNLHRVLYTNCFYRKILAPAHP